MNYEIVLAGCTPTPLASYLKALGILRLVAEQADPDARGCWRNDQFVLIGRLDGDGLRHYFLDGYRPTPVLAPWNGGSGFHPKDNRSGIDPIEQGAAERLAPFREAIRTARTVLGRQGIEEKPSRDTKTDLLAALRGEFDEEALAWFDAAVLLTEDSPRYPPLLGTGGNDGRLDFANNFMQRLVGLFDANTGAPKPEAGTYLDEALFARTVAGMVSTAIGQFSPGNAGGANQGSGFSSASLVNPWDFVLMIEGALLFAAAATRRLESMAPGTLSYPFTVRSTGAGSGGAALGDEGNARAEMWMPLWSAPTTLSELRALLAEGRATINRRPARDGLDFVRAVSRLGVERGITGFQRYAFMMRSGKAYLATPLSRVRVARNPAAHLIDDLDQDAWLARFRRLGRGAQATNRIQSLVRRLEDALFDLALDRDDPAPRVQHVLELLGEAQLYLARSPAAREVCPPVPSLPAEWLLRAQAGDGSPELAIAAALAGVYGRRRRHDGSLEYALPMRAHLAPEQSGRRPIWLKEERHRVTWGVGSVEDNLLTTLHQRLLEAERRELDDKPLYSMRTAAIGDVAAWLAGNLDGRRIASLLPGLALIRVPPDAGSRAERTEPLPAAYRLLKPFFCTNDQLHRAGLIEASRTLPIPVELIRRLAADDIAGAAKLGERQLRITGLPVRFPGLETGRGTGRRLLAALLVPIADFELRRLLPQRMERETETENAD